LSRLQKKNKRLTKAKQTKFQSNCKFTTQFIKY